MRSGSLTRCRVVIATATNQYGFGGNMRGNLLRVFTAGILIIAFVAPDPVYAADRAKIRTLNVGVQAVSTLISGIAQGKVHNLRDVWRCLGSGAGAGYGFYEAKALVGRGDVQTGWILANLAASVSENAAAGKNPISQLGYTVGPVRFRIPITKLDRTADSYVYIDVSSYQIGKLVQFYRINDDISTRDGLISFQRDTPYPQDDGAGPYSGRDFGVYPGVWVRASEDVWNHEVVHAIQSLQGDAIEPSLRVLTYAPKPGARKRIIRFEHLKSGALHLLTDEVTYRPDYENRWTEIEAYRLAEDTTP